MKYIFIDTNQYRHIFSLSEGFSDDVLSLLLKLIGDNHVTLLLPQQTKDEVERNRFYDWPNQSINNIENTIRNLNEKIKKLEKDFSEDDLKEVKRKIDTKIKKLSREKGEVPKRFTDLKSRQNQKLKKLFDRACLIPETIALLTAADFRFKKGNPPYDNEKFGDALIWESLLSYLESQKGSRPVLILIASDNKAWGTESLHLWLEREYKERVKGRICYGKRLSDIPGLTKEEQGKIQEKENQELKENAVKDFINSESFIGAGEHARRLIQFKPSLNSEDYKNIFIASLKNHEVYQSFFTADPLNTLFDNGDGYVVPVLENATSFGWERFKSFYNCQLKRHVDDLKNASAIEDVPF